MNKYQEALNEIASIKHVDDDGIDRDCIGYWNDKEIGILQELVDRATPRKPIDRHYEEAGESLYIKTTCPNGCCVQVSQRYDMFCPMCGQKLDWGDGDEK